VNKDYRIWKCNVLCFLEVRIEYECNEYKTDRTNAFKRRVRALGDPCDPFMRVAETVTAPEGNEKPPH